MPDGCTPITQDSGSLFPFVRRSRLVEAERARDGAYRELQRVEALRANSERVALKAFDLAERAFSWASHEPNHHRLLGALAELRHQLRIGKEEAKGHG